MLFAAVMGALFGFVSSMPVAGPIGAIVLSLCLEGRLGGARLVAFGAALAEAAYAFVAFYGVGSFLQDLPWVEPVSQALAVVILVVIAVALFRRTAPPGMLPQGSMDSIAPSARHRSFALGFAVSAMNPTLIATWAGAMTFVWGTGLVQVSLEAAIAFGLGVAVGIAGWFVLLVEVLRRVRRRFELSTLVALRRGTAVLVLLVAGWFLVALVRHFL
jgi:threonine/homoserine/homoserine lactone efflux protein